VVNEKLMAIERLAVIERLVVIERSAAIERSSSSTCFRSASNRGQPIGGILLLKGAKNTNTHAESHPAGKPATRRPQCVCWSALNGM
jgi:hypothetical protein